MNPENNNQISISIEKKTPIKYKIEDDNPRLFDHVIIDL